jgi:hypothetical protein
LWWTHFFARFLSFDFTLALRGRDPSRLLAFCGHWWWSDGWDYEDNEDTKELLGGWDRVEGK